MFQFVYWLKAFATAFITNAHYAGIWPIPALAHGGHLGNCLFFLISGFCLYHIRDPFPKWYVKRAVRIYPALWIVVAADLLAGRIKLGSLGAVFRCCLFPTWYHFIESIMLLYILYYGIRLLQKKVSMSMGTITAVTLGVFLVVYVLCFDKSAYHIDDPNQIWVRGQFIISMLLGALFRENYEKITEKIPWWNVAAIPVCLLGYLAMKLAVPRIEMLLKVQCLIQFFLVGLVSGLTLLCIRLEKRGTFQKIPVFLGNSAKFLSEITLEIYLGQILVIDRFSHLVFPVNLIVVTGLIVLYAWVIHKCAAWAGDQFIKSVRL